MVFGHVHEAVVVQHVDGRHRRRSRYRRGARAVGRPGVEVSWMEIPLAWWGE